MPDQLHNPFEWIAITSHKQTERETNRAGETVRTDGPPVRPSVARTIINCANYGSPHSSAVPCPLSASDLAMLFLCFWAE